MVKGRWPLLNSLSISKNNVNLDDNLIQNKGYEVLANNNNWPLLNCIRSVHWGCGCCTMFAESFGFNF